MIWSEVRREAGEVRPLELRLCSGAEVSIYGQARRTHSSLTSLSKWAWANRGRARLEGELGKANSGQTRLLEACRHAGALLTAAPYWHLRSSTAGEACHPYWHPGCQCSWVFVRHRQYLCVGTVGKSGNNDQTCNIILINEVVFCL